MPGDDKYFTHILKVPANFHAQHNWEMTFFHVKFVLFCDGRDIALVSIFFLMWMLEAIPEVKKGKININF